MKRPSLFVVLFLLLFSLVVMATYSQLLASDNYSRNESSFFAMFAAEELVGPENDYPCDAISLTISSSFSQFTSEYASLSDTTGSDNVPKGDIKDYKGGDVWFSITVPASGELFIETVSDAADNAWMDNVRFAIYEGDCSSPELIEDSEYELANNESLEITSIEDIEAGDDLLIRVWDHNNATGGIFEIIIYDECVGITVDAGDDAEICASESTYTISGTSSTNTSSVGWSTTGGGGFDNSSLENPTYTLVATDFTMDSIILTKTGWNSLGCPDVSDEMVLTISESGTANAGDGGDACSKNFTFNATGVGVWDTISSPGGSPTITYDLNTDSTATVTVGVYGTYEFEWTVDNGNCVDSDTITVNFYEQPTADAGDGGDVCSKIYIFNAAALSESETGVWSQVSGADSILFSNSLDPLSEVKVNDYGTYEFMWTVSNGTCVDSATITVNFYEPPFSIAEDDKEICGSLATNLSAYNSVGDAVWEKISEAGTAVFTTPDAFSTDVEVDAYGEYEFLVVVSNGTCSDSDTIVVNFYDAPTVDAGSDAEICSTEDIYSISGSSSINADSILWSTSGDGSFSAASDENPDYTVGSTDKSSGSVELIKTVTGNGSCAAVSDTLTLTITAAPAADAGLGGSECDLDFTFSANVSVGTGTWIHVSGPGNSSFSPSSNDPMASVVVDSYGSYEFEWTEANGTCSDSDNVVVTFYEQPIADAGIGGDECDLDFTFSANASVGIGTWTQVSGLGNSSFSPNSNDPMASVVVDSYGSYEFEWTESNGSCSDSDNVVVTFYDEPIADAGSGGNTCGLSFSLSAVPDFGVGSWSKISGSGNADFSPNSANGTVKVDEYGTYSFRWTEENASCTAYDDVEVAFYEQPVSNAGLGGDACGLEYTLSANESAGIGTWTVNSGDGNISFSPDASSANATAIADEYGSYQLIWTENNDICFDNDAIDITFIQQPKADAGEDISLEYAEQIEINAVLSTEGSGEWSLDSGSAYIYDAYSPNTFIDQLGLGENIFIWTETNQSCTDSDEIIVSVDKLFIPTVITPNGDDKNEYFVIRGSDNLDGIELSIFNRNGVEIYTDLNYNNDWNGLDRDGNKLTTDTYFYVLRTNENKVFKGYIVIKR
ncbi:gliding motility-associated C-terminal domain-containing protein [Labilibaculum sp.]|uniref:gliding motility-associated C-terminal domain-containing protein n=1 Tax=Labilibaculum sp. TaxID=2060723 RepID=UPI00356AE76E